MYPEFDMVDLHTHSDASDGEFSPGQLMQRAFDSGISVIALTDHDTLSGLNEADEKAQALKIRLIRGVETEVDSESGELHLLGLNLRAHSDETLRKFLQKVRGRRVSRNEEMVELMKKNNLDVSLEQINLVAEGEITGRMHFAHWLINHGYAKNVQECFERWIGAGTPYYVPKQRPSLDDALEAIHSVGGKVVIAHPRSLQISWKRMARCFSEWKERGMDGIEAYHSGATPEEAARFTNLALKSGLFITGGSDFHGSGHPDRRLGYGPGGKPLHDSLVQPFI